MTVNAITDTKKGRTESPQPPVSRSRHPLTLTNTCRPER